MPRAETVHLIEEPLAAPPGATIIDVDFRVVKRGRKPKSLGATLRGFAIAGLIGAAIPIVGIATWLALG